MLGTYINTSAHPEAHTGYSHCFKIIRIKGLRTLILFSYRNTLPDNYNGGLLERVPIISNINKEVQRELPNFALQNKFNQNNPRFDMGQQISVPYFEAETRHQNNARLQNNERNFNAGPDKGVKIFENNAPRFDVIPKNNAKHFDTRPPEESNFGQSITPNENYYNYPKDIYGDDLAYNDDRKVIDDVANNYILDDGITSTTEDYETVRFFSLSLIPCLSRTGLEEAIKVKEVSSEGRVV